MRIVFISVFAMCLFLIVHGKSHRHHKDSTSEVESYGESYQSASEDDSDESSSSSEESSSEEIIRTKKRSIYQLRRIKKSNSYKTPRPKNRIPLDKKNEGGKLVQRTTLALKRRQNAKANVKHSVKRRQNKVSEIKNDEETYDSLENFNDDKDSTQVDDVKMTFVIFRHGLSTPDRKEISRYTNFKVKDLFDADLTPTGKNQSYQVGKYLRNRYGKILSKVYTPKEIQVRTIDNDMAKRSILLALHALYPPLGEELDNPLLLQPVPYDSLSSEEDDLRANDNCPTYQKLRDETIALKPVMAKLNKLESSMELLYEVTGKNYSITDLYTLSRIFNIMFMFKKFPINELTYTFTEIAMREISRMSFWTQLYNATLIRLAAGVMINEILEAIDMIHENVTTIKMYLVAGTDFNVASILAAVRVFAVHQPEPGSIFCLEIYYSNEKKDFGVRAVYKPESNVETKILNIKGCDRDGYCSTREFKKLSQKYTMTESQYKAECRSINNTTNVTKKHNLFNVIK